VGAAKRECHFPALPPSLSLCLRLHFNDKILFHAGRACVYIYTYIKSSKKQPPHPASNRESEFHPASEIWLKDSAASR